MTSGARYHLVTTCFVKSRLNTIFFYIFVVFALRSMPGCPLPGLKTADFDLWVVSSEASSSFVCASFRFFIYFLLAESFVFSIAFWVSFVSEAPFLVSSWSDYVRSYSSEFSILVVFLVNSAISSSDSENLTCKVFFLLSLPFDFKLDSFLFIYRVLIEGTSSKSYISLDLFVSSRSSTVWACRN